MATETVSAWFLHKRLSGDTSCRVSFYTREHGIIEALYKGGRTPKKQALLQPFTPLWLVLDVKREWYYVRQLELEAPSLFLKGHSLFSALYLNEILYMLLKPRDPDQDLYFAYVNALEGLAKASERLMLEPIIRRFERSLLSAVGYALELTHDAKTGRNIDPSGHYHFIAGVGLIESQKGLSGAHILAFADDRLDCIESMRTAKLITRKAIALAIDGKEIQSRAFFLGQPTFKVQV